RRLPCCSHIDSFPRALDSGGSCDGCLYRKFHLGNKKACFIKHLLFYIRSFFFSVAPMPTVIVVSESQALAAGPLNAHFAACPFPNLHVGRCTQRDKYWPHGREAAITGNKNP